MLLSVHHWCYINSQECLVPRAHPASKQSTKVKKKMPGYCVAQTTFSPVLQPLWDKIVSSWLWSESRVNERILFVYCQARVVKSFSLLYCLVLAHIQALWWNSEFPVFPLLCLTERNIQNMSVWKMTDVMKVVIINVLGFFVFYISNESLGFLYRKRFVYTDEFTENCLE